VSWFSSLWQKIKKPFEITVIVVISVLVIALLVIIVLAYIFNVNVPGLRGKNLWDWLQLLIIPAVLAVGGYLFNYTTSRTEREIASDRQCEDALQSYINSMSTLLLDKDLRQSNEDAEVRTIAGVRTLTVLPRLDRVRKKSVLQFLYESGLIDKATRIVDLDEADFSRADLRRFNLNDADLRGVNLRGADLRGAELDSTDLASAKLYMANIRFTKLSKVNLCAAFMKRADLSGSLLMETNLSGAYLMETNLQEIQLLRVDLSEAFLEKANLQKALLVEVSLQGADLSGANLSGVKVIRDQLNQAKSLKGTTMPDGTKHA
jgi:uncharacterized protein YjbI with pentapeptide repeats